MPKHIQLAKTPDKRKEINFLKVDSPGPVIQDFIKGIPTERGNEVINSVVSPNKKQLIRAWKYKIANNIYKKKKPLLDKLAVLSITFFFCKKIRGNRKFDLDNYVKPVIDGIAKGLFSKDWKREKKQEKVRFGEDDSIFKKIYLESHEIEGKNEKIHITVWFYNQNR